MWGLSAIMALFVCGITMSHYTFHNISEPSQKGSVMTINTLGHAAEAFLFIYLGIGIYSTDQRTFNMKLTMLIIAGGFVARAASVFIPLGIYAAVKKCKISISFKQLVIIWFSGLIRGAIAFALSLKIPSKISEHKNSLVSLTLIIVLMTTIIFGGLMAAFAKLIGLSVESTIESHDIIARSSQIVDRKTALERDDSSWLQKKWRSIDNNYIKRLFGGDLSKTGKKVKHHEHKSKDESKFKPKKSTRESLFQGFEK